MELLLLIWLPLCIAVAVLANRYNRNAFGWLVLSLLLSPLVGVAFVLALGPAQARVTEPEAPAPTPEEVSAAWRDASEAMARKYG